MAARFTDPAETRDDDWRRVEHRRQVNTYAYLWHGGDELVRDAEQLLGDPEGPARPAGWELISAMVLTAFAFEAYLNHVAAPLKGFRPALGRPKKLNLLRRDFALPAWPEKDRPYSSVEEAFTIRGGLAHARSEVLESEVLVQGHHEYELAYRRAPRARWEGAFDLDRVRVVRADVRTIIETIHAAAAPPEDRLWDLGVGHTSGHWIGTLE